MSDAATIATLVREVKQLTSEVRGLKREVSSLKEQKERSHWAHVHRLKQYTGWTDWEVREARKYNWVKYELVEGTTKTYRYDLNSIEEKYFKKIA